MVSPNVLSHTPSRRRMVDFQFKNDAQKAAEVCISNNVSKTIVISEDDDNEPTEKEQRQNARLIADFKLELQQSEKRAKLEASRCESLELELKGALQESQDLHRQLQVKSIIANFLEKAFSTFSSSYSSSSQCYVFLTSKDARRNKFH